MNFINKIFLIICCVLLPIIAVAQDFSISGLVEDEQNLPISYANVIVSDIENSKPIKGTTSNESGLFNIDGLEANTYLLEISFLGFETYKDTVALGTDINLKRIILKEKNEELGGVTVIAKRPTLKKEADRLVFNVENTALSEGNLLEVLKHTPSVLVLNNKISVRNSSPTVYINDRKIHLSDEELLQLLEGSPANSIKSVEVITNPSAKYDAESDIVLNIIMSKNLITGYRGTVFGNYTQGVYPRYNAGISNFYKTDKINLFASYSFNDEKITRVSKERINFLDTDNNVVEIWNSDLDRNAWSKTHNFNFNLDFFADENNTLSFSTNVLYLPSFNYIINGHTDVIDSFFEPSYSFDNKNTSNDDKYNIGFDLNYDRKFKNDSKVSINAHLTTYDYNRDQNVLSTYYDLDDAFDYNNEYKTKSDQKTIIYTGEFDYSLPINDNESSFSAGAKTSFINTESEINYYNIEDNISTFNIDNSNAFDYHENIYAAYADYKTKSEQWDLAFGLRVEQTETNGKSLVINNTLERDYFNWFPNASISFQASERISIYSNYKRSIERPDFQSLNPFKFFLNDNTIVTGNPNLQPLLTDRINFGISLNKSFFVSAYYKSIKDNFMELPLQDNENNLLIYTPTNLTSTIDYGFEFIGFYDITNRWNIYLATSFYNMEDLATINGEVLQQDTWSNYTELSNSFKFLEDNSLTASLLLIYLGKNQQGFQIVDTRIASEISIRKTIFNKKGSITLSASDLFNEQDYDVVSKYLNQDNLRFLNQDNRYVKLGFSYKFGNTSLETNERTKEHKERNRLK